jgi:hypothetical protein
LIGHWLAPFRLVVSVVDEGGGAVVTVGFRGQQGPFSMSSSPYIELANRLLEQGRAWESPTHCRDVAAGLRRDGERDLAVRLEAAAIPPRPPLGSCVLAV